MIFILPSKRRHVTTSIKLAEHVECILWENCSVKSRAIATTTANITSIAQPTGVASTNLVIKREPQRVWGQLTGSSQQVYIPTLQIIWGIVSYYDACSFLAQ